MSHHRRHSRRQLSVEYPKYPPPNSPTQRRPFEYQAMYNTIISDYESDVPAPQLSALPTALPPIARTKEDMNLSVIQKHNPKIVSILSTAPYATIYDFASDPEPGWQKSGVVGTLFICELTHGSLGEQRYHIIVLNRNGLDNFEAELIQSETGGVEIMDEYVIISKEIDGKSVVFGIYIYSEGEGSSTAYARAANGELMKQLALAAKNSRAAAEAQAQQVQIPRDPTPLSHIQHPQPQPRAPSHDLLALLQGPPTPSPAPQAQTQQHFQQSREPSLPPSQWYSQQQSAMPTSHPSAMPSQYTQPPPPPPQPQKDLLSLFLQAPQPQPSPYPVQPYSQPPQPPQTSQNDLLALLRGPSQYPSQPAPEPSVPYEPPSQNNVLNDLFRKAGLA